MRAWEPCSGSTAILNMLIFYFRPAQNHNYCYFKYVLVRFKTSIFRSWTSYPKNRNRWMFLCTIRYRYLTIQCHYVSPVSLQMCLLKSRVFHHFFIFLNIFVWFEFRHIWVYSYVFNIYGVLFLSVVIICTWHAYCQNTLLFKNTFT